MAKLLERNATIFVELYAQETFTDSHWIPRQFHTAPSDYLASSTGSGMPADIQQRHLWYKKRKKLVKIRGPLEIRKEPELENPEGTVCSILSNCQLA